ncbi:DUF1533 domain-containing protein, partial [Clostridium sp. Sa3CUN1]|nr:DUF1533 domain-containing protein [Clostridium gallinarum]
VTIEITNTKNTSAKDFNFVLDSIEVINEKTTVEIIEPGKYEQDNINISYKGSWNNQNSPSYSGGSAMLSNKIGDTITFQFNGTGIKLYSYKAYICGIAKVTIDNETYSIDTYSPSAIAKALILDKNDLVPGNHTVTIEITNTKNTSAKDFNFVLDSIEVLE